MIGIRRPRVIWVTPWFPDSPTDGRFSFIFRAAEALVQQGVELRIVVLRPWIPRLAFTRRASSGGRPPRGFGPGLDVRTITFPRLPRMILLRYSYFVYRLVVGPLLRRQILEFDPDVVHAHTDWAAYSAVPAAQRLGRRSVVSIHAADVTQQIVNVARTRGRLARTLAAASQVLMVGSPVRPYLHALGVDTREFLILPNGYVLPPGIGTPPSVGSGGELRLVTISRLDRGKAIDIALVALARLRDRGVSSSYEIIGEGPMKRTLEALVRELQLSHRVRFLGQLDHDRAMRQLVPAHAFLFPSYKEAFGVAALEAMATGLVTVAVEGQGPSDFIRHGDTGFLVPPANPSAIADVLEQLASDPSKAGEVAAAGKQFAEENLTWNHHAIRLLAAYERTDRKGAERDAASRGLSER